MASRPVQFLSKGKFVNLEAKPPFQGLSSSLEHRPPPRKRSSQSQLGQNTQTTASGAGTTIFRPSQGMSRMDMRH